MEINYQKVVAIHYTLTDSKGERIDASEAGEPLYYLHGYKNIIEGLEEALLGKAAGDKLTVSIPPEKAYGGYNENDKLQAKRDQFDGIEELKIGMEIQTRMKEGIKMYRIEKIFGDTVFLDGNHALAGETLNFDVEVMEVRNATQEELEHGHVHRPGDHHH